MFRVHNLSGHLADLLNGLMIQCWPAQHPSPGWPGIPERIVLEPLVLADVVHGGPLHRVHRLEHVRTGGLHQPPCSGSPGWGRRQLERGEIIGSSPEEQFFH